MEWDPAKRLSNLRKHGLDFRDAVNFDFDEATIEYDELSDPHELREIATSFIGNRICVMTYTRRDQIVRVISLRLATRREAADYVEALDGRAR